MTYALITLSQKNHLIEEFIDAVSNLPHYVFLGGHNTIETKLEITESTKSLEIDAFRNMISGKRITSNDIKKMIRNIPYVTNKVFAMYDDKDGKLNTKDFYTVVDEGSYKHVYKCLDNNNGANSTVQPDFSHISGSNTVLYQTSDGYRWKYMYSVQSSIVDKFASDTYFPIVSNTTVESSAINGAIDIIKIIDKGEKYNNYLSGTFSSGDIRVNSNTNLHKLSISTASTINSFYSDCLLYISSGDGIGQVRTIADYFCNTTGNYIVTNTSLTEINNGSGYQIYPRVKVTGDGNQFINVIARALVNSSSSNSIYRIEIFERGKGYRYANAQVLANSVVGITSSANLQVIYGPMNGHGANAALELGTTVAGVSIKFSNSESNTIPTSNKFKQIGLLKEPLFANVQLNLSSPSAAFSQSEVALKINPIKIGVGNITTTSSNLNISLADYGSYLTANTLLYIRSADNTSYCVATVNNVVNSSLIKMTSNGKFISSNVIIYLANNTANCIMSTVTNQYNVYASNVHPSINVGDLLIGSNSGSIATVNVITRNAVVKNMDTFVQLQKYALSGVTGVFTPNEIVYQTNTQNANALLFSVINNNTMYVSNQVGSINWGGTNTVMGANSGASATLANSYCGELVFGSGELLYIENVDAITRANDQTETINLYLEF